MITTTIITILISIWKLLVHTFNKKSLTTSIVIPITEPVSTVIDIIADKKKLPELVKIESIPVVKVDIPIKVKKDEEVIKTIKIPKIINKFLPENQYMGKRNSKINQIVLHHTQGGSFNGAYDTFLNSKQKVGVNYCLDKDGTIYCTIPEDSWGYQLGLRFKSNQIFNKYKTKEWSDSIEKSAIGIEVVNEGELQKTEKGYYFEGGNRYIDSSKVVKLNQPFRDYEYFVDFTEAQYKSLELLLLYLTEKYNIPKEYTHPFNISDKALSKISGVWGHTSYRYPDKTDCAPLPKLIDLLKNLKNN